MPSTSTRHGEAWTDEEIKLLDEFLQSGVEPSIIAKGLSRSDTAVKHAICKLIYQQLLEHSPETIAERYKKDLSWVTSEIVDPKYYVDFESEEDEEDCDTDSEISLDLSRDKLQAAASANVDLTTSLLVIAMFSAAVTTVVSGMGYYGCKLYMNGF